MCLYCLLLPFFLLPFFYLLISFYLFLLFSFSIRFVCIPAPSQSPGFHVLLTNIALCDFTAYWFLCFSLSFILYIFSSLMILVIIYNAFVIFSCVSPFDNELFLFLVLHNLFSYIYFCNFFYFLVHVITTQGFNANYKMILI